MKLDKPFYSLPLSFDADRLAAEALQFEESEWRRHPSGYEGNTALILVSSHGEDNDDMGCPMRPTPRLARCPYIRQVMASFGTLIGRARLMRLDAGAAVNEHCDINYYWRNRIRLHIPIVTDPAVSFICDGKTVHMGAGEAWTFDNWRMHQVQNPSDVQRIHLVIDTVGSAALWRMIQQADTGKQKRLVPYIKSKSPELSFESHDREGPMPPAELDTCLAELASDLLARENNDPAASNAMLEIIEDTRHDWRSAWMLHGGNEQAAGVFTQLVERALRQADGINSSLAISSNNLAADSVLREDLRAALPRQGSTPAATGKPVRIRYDRPVFIVAAPRSGSTLLFETLAANRAFVTVGDESHAQFEGIPALNPAKRGYDSNRLDGGDASAEVALELMQRLGRDLRTSDGTPLAALAPEARAPTQRFLEKTPKNALRIPFLCEVFPDARFIYLYRNARDNISSLLDSWRSGRYVTYPELPDWEGQPWSHLLVPGWKQLSGAPLAEVVREQWRITNETILDDLEALPADRWTAVSYEDLLNATPREIERLCGFADVPFGPRMQELVSGQLQPSRYTLTPPDPDKWRRNADELEPVLDDTAALTRRIMELPL